MKTTLEIPDALFRRAKSAAAELGLLRDLRKENARIDRIIEEEFEQIEPEDWQ